MPITPFLIWSIAKVFIIVVEYILRCAKFWRIIIIILVTVLDFILLLGRSRPSFVESVLSSRYSVLLKDPIKCPVKR